MTPKIVTSFIGGKWVEPNENAHKIKIIHPADEQHVSTLYEADANEVNSAAEAAKKTFDSGVWPNPAIKCFFCCLCSTVHFIGVCLIKG